VTVLALGVLALGLTWHSTSDLDLPLHDRTGRELLAGAGLPHANRYSFTAPDHAWLDHEWGFQLLVAAAGNLAGGDDLEGRTRGWQLVRLLLGAALVGAAVAAARRAPRPLPRLLPLLGPVGLLTLTMLWTRLTLRPELVSYVLFLLVIPRVEATLASATGRFDWRDLVDPRRPGGQAFLLTVLWYQCHGFAALAVLLWLLAGLLGPGPLSTAARWRLALGGAGLAATAGVLTPNLLDGLLYPWRALSQFGQSGVDLRQTISELIPLLETRGSLALTLLAFRTSLVWGALWIVARWGRLSPLRVALWLLAAVAAWQGQRNLGFYALAFLLLHGDPGTGRPSLWDRLAARLPARARRVAAVASGGGLPAATPAPPASRVVARTRDPFYLREGVARRWGGGITPATYPTAQAAALAAESPLRIANNVDAASTLIHAGAGPLAIDGRTEAYPERAWREYATVKAGDAAALRQLRAWQTQAVCLAHRNTASHALLATLLRDPGWTLTAADEAGVILRPRGDAPAADAEHVLRQATVAFAARLAATPPGRDVRLADAGAALAGLLQLAVLDSLAESTLAASLDRCPDHPTLRHNLGNRLLARGEYERALANFTLAARLNRNAAPPLVNAGNCLVQLGRLRESERSFARAVARDPRNFEGWANLAEGRRRLGDRDGAAAAYRRALGLRPDDVRLRARAQTL